MNILIKNGIGKYISHYLDVPEGFGKIGWLVLVESLAMSISFYISVYFSKGLGFNSAEIGNCISSALAGSLFAALSTGYLSTKMQSLRLASIGFFLFSCVFIFLPMIKNIHQVIPLMFLSGFSSVFMMTANLTSLAQLSEDKHLRNKAIVMQSVIFNLTVTITAYFVSTFSYQSLKVLFFLTSFLLFSSGLITHRLSSINPCKPNSNTMQSEKKYSVNFSLLIFLIPIIICYSIVCAMVKGMFAIDAMSRFDNYWLSWMLLSLNPILVVFLQPTVFGLIKNKDNYFSLTVGGLCLCLGYLFFGVTKFFIPSLIFIFFATIGEMIVAPISKSLASSSLGKGYEGVGISMWKVIYYTSGMIGASSTGYIGLKYSHKSAWLICIPLSIIIMFCFFSLNGYISYKGRSRV